MDERLAKGYAKQLINWFDLDYKKANKEFNKALNDSKKLFESAKSFEKFVNKLKSIYKNFYVNTLFVRSKKAPFFCYVTFQPEEIIYKNWTEKGLSCDVGYLSLSANEDLEMKMGHYLIGEHAIARTFERSNIINESNKHNPYIIINEFKFVPLWSNFWKILKVILKKEMLNFNPIIPTCNGLFYCEHRESADQSFALDLRTYVGKNILTESQNKLREQMLNASVNLENCIFSFLPQKAGNYENIEMYDFMILFNRTIKFIAPLSKEIFRSKDEVEISIFINSVNTVFKEWVNPDQVRHLEPKLLSLGYEDFYLNLESESKKKEYHG